MERCFWCRRKFINTEDRDEHERWCDSRPRREKEKYA